MAIGRAWRTPETGYARNSAQQLGRAPIVNLTVILLALGSAFQRLFAPGGQAAVYGRQVESSEDSARLEALEKAGKLKRIPFTDRAEMKKLVDPVIAAYA